MHFKAKAAIQVCRKIYESGNKCSELLPKSVRDQRLANYIPHIMSLSGQKVSFPKHIAKEFQGFYASLYNLQRNSPPQMQVTDYLANSQMPKLTAEVSDLLDEPITLEEIQNAIENSKQGKAPGPDELKISCFKTPNTIPRQVHT